MVLLNKITGKIPSKLLLKDDITNKVDKFYQYLKKGSIFTIALCAHKVDV